MTSGIHFRSRLPCLAISTLLFVSVAVAVVLGASDGIDAAVRSFVNGKASPALTAFFSFVTVLGSTVVVFLLAGVEALALVALGRRRDAAYIAIVMAAAAVLNYSIKIAVARERPEAFFGDVPDSHSFASGHALFSACAYGVVGSLIAAEMPRKWQRNVILAATFALVGAIGLSRIYLGVHYPTDVLAGFALAALIVCTVGALMGRERAKS